MINETHTQLIMLLGGLIFAVWFKRDGYWLLLIGVVRLKQWRRRGSDND